MISEQYRQDLTEAHESREHFGKRGSRWAEAVMQLCMQYKTMDVLDYGCGKAELNLHLPFGVNCYDPGVVKFDLDPDPADIVVCTDVLEHIEPEHLDAVLDHLYAKTKKALFAVISLIPAAKHFPDGRNYHLIVESQDWWMAKLDRWKVVHGPTPGIYDKEDEVSPPRFEKGDPIEFSVLLEPIK